MTSENCLSLIQTEKTEYQLQEVVDVRGNIVQSSETRYFFRVCNLKADCQAQLPLWRNLSVIRNRYTHIEILLLVQLDILLLLLVFYLVLIQSEKTRRKEITFQHTENFEWNANVQKYVQWYSAQFLLTAVPDKEGEFRH